jgi:hypothetical protein
MREEEMRGVAGQVMADLERNKPASAGIVLGGLSPLSETLWKDKTTTDIIGLMDLFIMLFSFYFCLLFWNMDQPNVR